MRKAIMVIATGFLLTGLGSGQNRRTANEPATPRSGRAILIRSPGFVAASLKELVERADCIVDGTVESVLPARLANPRDTSTVETDVVIAVARILKGPDLRKLSLSQPGGKRGAVEVIPGQDALVRQGERYILFLTADKRAPVSPDAELPRYVLTGAWSGKFRVDNGRITPAAETGPGIRAHQDQTVDAFVAQIRTLKTH